MGIAALVQRTLSEFGSMKDARIQPIATIRYRKYDGTRCKKLIVETVSRGLQDQLVHDKTKGHHELFVTEACFTMVFRQIQAGAESFIVLKCPQPTRQQPSDSPAAGPKLFIKRGK